MAPPQSGYSSTEIWIELEFGNVGFGGRENRSTRRKKLSEQRREPTTNSIPSHIGGRRVLSPLRHLLPSFHLSRTFLSVGGVSNAVFLFVGCCFFLLLVFEKLAGSPKVVLIIASVLTIEHFSNDCRK